MWYNQGMSKNDITKSAIENTFLALLDEHPLSEISVRDITSACGINRNTFYYHYNNIAALLESVIRKMVDDILAQYPPTFASLEDCFLAAINLARKNKRIIYNIYHSTNRAIFERHLWHVCDYSISSFVDSLSTSTYEAVSEERAVIKDFLKFECFGFAIDWINRGMPGDVDEKAHLFLNIMLANIANI